MQRRTLLLCLLMLALTAGACTPARNNQITAPKKKGPTEQIKIGFSMDTLKEERWQRDKKFG